MQRNTAQQKQVMDVLRRMANHPSAEMVYDEVHKEYPRISKATVYRILREEANCGCLRNVDIPRDVNRYDHRTDEHWHIRCRECGRIGDVELREGMTPSDVIYAPEGWTVEYISLALTGICADCMKKSADE